MNCWDILDTYFQKGASAESVNPLVKHQIDSYNKFIDHTLQQITSGFNPIKISNTLKNENCDQSHKIYINVLQPSLTKPLHHLQDGTQTIMTPYLARMNKWTYSSSLYVNVNIHIESVNKDGVIEKFNKTINGVYIGKIPVMVRSKACILQQMPALGEESNNECKNECRYDYGGYFIINGSEKVLISQDRINENKTLVFQNNNEGLYAEIRSMSDASYLPPKTTSLNMSGKLNHMGRIIRMNTSFIKSEIPVFVMFRALGVISDKEILQHIIYDLDNKDNQRIITELMACCEDACDVHTQEQAEQVLIKVMTGVNKTINPTDLLKSNITNDFLPHVGKSYRRKALYLGYMIRKMIRIYLGYDNYDNRDSYMNKRIDTPGILMSNLFRQCYGKMTKEIKVLIERELNLWRANQNSIATCDIISDNNIHRYFRQSLLESWLKYSLSTGNWGIKSIGSFQNIRQGVSQVLNRMSYASTLSHLRRINTAMEKNGKLVQPRKLDNSQIGMICPAETPEGASVGLVKNMALSTNISVYMNSSHIRNLLIENGVQIYDDTIASDSDKSLKNQIVSDYLKNLGCTDNVVIQINGDIIGYHKDPYVIYNKLKHYKRCGNIYPMTSIVWNIKARIIIISTEAGRMYRPLLIVDTDPETGKRDLRINRILQKQGITWQEYIKDKTFDTFLVPSADMLHSCEDEEEGFIEYLDCDEINHSMIAMFPNELEKGMKGISYPPCYTHCEIHPSLINGILGVNIPFSNHNQSPRNCYQCLSETEKVLMSNGTQKMIKDVSVGDEVVCFDLKTKQRVHTKVIHHYNRLTAKIVCNISVASGRIITATNDHKFMTNKGWKTCAEFDRDTLVGIYMMNMGASDHIENVADIMVTDDNASIWDYYAEMGLLPLKNNNPKLAVIARLAGYYAQNKLHFNNDYDRVAYNRDVEYIGFKEFGIYDTKFIIYIEKLLENNGWMDLCSEMVQVEYLAAYLSALYPQRLADINVELPAHIENLMQKNGVGGWHLNNKSILDFYKKVGLRYNNDLLGEVAVIAEYMMHKNYCNMVNIDKIRKIWGIEEWKQKVYVQGDLVFVPFNMTNVCKNNKISDITVESDHHSFIGGNGFAVSNCAMGKQALGIYTSNFNKRIDTMGNILNYSQKPLVYTRLSKYTYSNELPAGTNAIVAIMTHTGFNQEDSVIINQSALDRGLFTTTYYKSVKDQCTKNHSTGEEEVFTNPQKCNAVTPKPFSYAKLDDQGFVPKNTYVNGSDIIIGKVMPKKINGAIINQDNSLPLKQNDDGYVDMNYMGTNSEGYKFCNMRLRKNRVPQIGDKLACYSPDHEYLTTDGWIPVAELTKEHKVASMVGEKLVYQHPEELYEFDYEGKMYSVETNHASLLVTPNHRMYYRCARGKYWKIDKAEDIINRKYKFKKNVNNWEPDYTDPAFPKQCFRMNADNTEITHFVFEAYTDGNGTYQEEYVIDIESWITIYGIYLAEGTVGKYLVQIAAHKPRVQNALDEVAAKSGIKITKCLDKGEYVSWNICSRHISNQLGLGYIAITKKLQEWVWWLNRKQADDLIKAMCLGDGGMMANGTWRYYTSSDQIADQFQRLCLHAGHSCNKKLKTKKGTRNVSLEKLNFRQKLANGQNIDEIVVPESYTNADYWVLTIITSQNEPIVNKYINKSKNELNYQDNWVDYSGKVYCCKMPIGEGIVYVKRRGLPIWCGQSRSAQKGSIGMVYRHQDMPFTKDGIVPDIIMNPHAIPSRMTMAQLMECIMGKAGCYIGACGDATPFNDCSVESIAKVLELSGMERYGNEIMYNGRTGEQIQTEIFIGPTYYQRLKHMVADKIHCLTGDHEVLTDNGWKFIPDVKLDDKVAILKDNKLVYECPLQTYSYPNYKGKMYRVKNDYIDLDVTMNHRMYVRTPGSDEYSLQKAEDIIGKVQYKNNADWDMPDYPTIPVENLQELLEDCARLPEWVWKLSQTQARSLIHTDVYYTSSDLADDLMRLCLHSGWSATKSAVDDMWKVSVLKSDDELIVDDTDAEVYDYTGAVYCLSVSTEVFMVRHNGKAAWTGNSRGSNGPIVMLTRQASEGRSKNGGLRLGEMERDCLIGHGISEFLKEKMLDTADNYRIFVCKGCGMLCDANPSKNIFKCRHCKTSTDITQVRIPYAFKLLTQELYSMGIKTGFNCA
jgi:DNA-directed RNA polymerase beta subunit